MMTKPDRTSLTIALAQLNCTVGDIAGNADLVRRAMADPAAKDSDVIVFSELFISGYPPEDLVLKPAFQAATREAVEALAKETGEGGPAVLVGVPWMAEGRLYNAVAHLDEGRVKDFSFKVDLPNYGVFDEKRVFDAGPRPRPLDVRGVKIGVPICEDIWQKGVCQSLSEQGAELFIVPNGSPWSHHKREARMQQARARVTETGLPLLYVHQVGGQDELVFDGAGFALDTDGNIVLQMADWREEICVSRWQKTDKAWLCKTPQKVKLSSGDAAVYRACVLGLRDYVTKNGFPGVVLGLSGGIDSALCAAIAVDALGPGKVHCVMLPYRYTSNESLNDAAACAEALGVRYDILAIEKGVDGLNATLAPLFGDAAADVTEENIQSRARGALLMALSNKFGSMVVTTGNKSEVSVGYATLYGDMNGGFNPIKDLYKSEVYALARYRNAKHPDGCLGPPGEVIPENIITKAPTAELRAGQLDQDSLPPYDILDDILACLVEKEMPLSEVVARGHEAGTVKRIAHLLYIAEYKRRQAAPGIKISERNFGRDRRYPITNRFREEL